MTVFNVEAQFDSPGIMVQVISPFKVVVDFVQSQITVLKGELKRKTILFEEESFSLAQYESLLKEVKQEADYLHELR